MRKSYNYGVIKKKIQIVVPMNMDPKHCGTGTVPNVILLLGRLCRYRTFFVFCRTVAELVRRIDTQHQAAQSGRTGFYMCCASSDPDTGSYDADPDTCSYDADPDTGSYDADPDTSSYDADPDTGSYDADPDPLFTVQ